MLTWLLFALVALLLSTLLVLPLPPWALTVGVLKAQFWILLFSLYTHSLGDLIQSSGFKLYTIWWLWLFLSPTQTSFLSSRFIHPNVYFTWKFTDTSNLTLPNSVLISLSPQPAFPTIISNAVNGNSNFPVVQLTHLHRTVSDPFKHN